MIDILFSDNFLRILNWGRTFAFFSLFIFIHMTIQESFISPSLKLFKIHLTPERREVRAINLRVVENPCDYSILLIYAFAYASTTLF